MIKRPWYQFAIVVLQRVQAGARIVHIHWSSVGKTVRVMQTARFAVCVLLASLTLGQSGCARPQPVAPPPPGAAPAAKASEHEYAGWYTERDGGAVFQPCGQDVALRVGKNSELDAHSQRFGMTPDSPVYVRLRGREADGSIEVTAVVQFGSPTPVRDCAMRGTVTQ